MPNSVFCSGMRVENLATVIATAVHRMTQAGEHDGQADDDADLGPGDAAAVRTGCGSATVVRLPIAMAATRPSSSTGAGGRLGRRGPCRTIDQITATDAQNDDETDQQREPLTGHVVVGALCRRIATVPSAASGQPIGPICCQRIAVGVWRTTSSPVEIHAWRYSSPLGANPVSVRVPGDPRRSMTVSRRERRYAINRGFHSGLCRYAQNSENPAMTRLPSVPESRTLSNVGNALSDAFRIAECAL